jgi:hypothetical protein
MRPQHRIVISHDAYRFPANDGRAFASRTGNLPPATSVTAALTALDKSPAFTRKAKQREVKRAVFMRRRKWI